MSDQKASAYAERRAAGRCVRCNCTIGVPPTAAYCEQHAAANVVYTRAKRGRAGGLEKPIINPTFADFERDEQRRGKR